jgi:DNA (cytosine-5)-methyltransferase 1
MDFWLVGILNGHFRTKILDAFRGAGYSRTAILPILASDFGVPQHRNRVFVFGLRDGLACARDFAKTAQTLLEQQKVARPVTLHEALSDLPEAVSEDNAPLPYPKKRGGRYSEYQRLVRLDCDDILLSSAQKRAQLAVDALYNHHTKRIGVHRKKIIAAIRPGGLPPRLWNGIRGHKWRRLDPDKPSYTILAQMHRDLSEWIHPTLTVGSASSAS